MHDQAAEDGAPPAELEAIDKALAEYFTREVRKVNGIAEAIHSYEAAAAQASSEAKRMKERAETLESTAKRIKAATLRAMQDHQVRVLETPEHRLRVQANGGVDPIELLDDPAKLPDKFQLKSVTTSMETWYRIGEWLGKYNGGLDLWHTLLSILEGTPPQANTHEIRLELKKTVPCPECKGSRKRIVDQLDADPEVQDCPRCKGNGTVPATIPGARLLPRGYHLRVE